jgi:hypothetical protein
MRQCIEYLNGYMHIKKNNTNNICPLTNLLLIYLSHKANIIPMQNAGHLLYLHDSMPSFGANKQ